MGLSHVVPLRPSWRIRAEFTTGQMVCGRIPAGYAVRAREAVAEFLRRRPELSALKKRLRAYRVMEHAS